MTAEIIVETTAGRIRGTSDRGVEIFKGIPYAVPPLGDLRFRPPRRPEPWAGVRDALEYGNMAVQSQNVFALPDDLLRLFTLAGKQKLDEDCLYLNVWTSGREGSERPVLFWCHGGAFITGSGSSPWSDGANLCRLDDVVVVSFNHRLGALGTCISRTWPAVSSMRASRACSTSWRPSNGCATTSPGSAVIRTTSPSSANRAAVRR
ncbi:MAG: carboxylesterase family protein [Reyranella sp.]